MLKKFIKNIGEKRLRTIVYSLQALAISPTIYFIYLSCIGTATKDQLNFWAMLSLLAGALFLIFMLFLVKFLENNDHE